MTVLWMCPDCHACVTLHVDTDRGDEHLARQVAMQVRVHFAGHRAAA